MSTTPNLALTYMAEGSAQKEVIHNSNMNILDASFAGFSVGDSKNLTNAAVNLFEVALAAGQRAGGVILSSILVSDGVNQQVLTEFIQWACTNKGGVYTTRAVAVPEADSLVAEAGTLVATWDFLNGTNKVTMRVTPTTSLTFTSYVVTYTLINHSGQVITFL